MKLNVFGRELEVTRSSDGWKVFYVGNEGKKRIARDINIPEDITEMEVANFLADLCHEWATPRHPNVSRYPNVNAIRSNKKNG